MSNSTTPTLDAGWSLGDARKTHAPQIFHYFKGADHVSLCGRKQRSSLSEVNGTAEEAYKCARCDQRLHDRPVPKPATPRRANG